MKPKQIKIGGLTSLGEVMDITESWRPEIKGQTLYYVTKTPEKYRRGKSCGIWKLAKEFKPVTARGE